MNALAPCSFFLHENSLKLDANDQFAIDDVSTLQILHSVVKVWDLM